MSEDEKFVPRREQVREEISDAQRQDRVRVREQAELLQGLITHPGWKAYQAIIAAQAQNHLNELQRPLMSPDGVMKQEYAKGTLNGLSAALMTPSVTIEQAKQSGVFNDPDTAAGKE